MNKQTIQTIDLRNIAPEHMTDDVAGQPVLEILYENAWILAPEDIWESWTGLRRKNGEDFHGDVRPLKEPTKIWTGSRVCSCRTCQTHTEAKYRPN